MSDLPTLYANGAAIEAERRGAGLGLYATTDAESVNNPVAYVPAARLREVEAALAAMTAERDALRERVERAEKERDNVIECNEAMRAPMRRLRESVGDFGSGESVVVDKVLAAKAAAEAKCAALEAACRATVEEEGAAGDAFSRLKYAARLCASALRGGTAALDAVREADQKRIAALQALTQTVAMSAVNACADAIRQAFVDQYVRGEIPHTETGLAETGERAAYIVRTAGMREVLVEREDDGTTALSAHTSAAVAAREAEIRKRVESLPVQRISVNYQDGDYLLRADVLAAIGGK